MIEASHASAFGWALHCCDGNRNDAADLLQSVYLQILEGRARYGGKSSFQTWLFSVIRKNGLRRRRKATRQLALLAALFARSVPRKPAEEDRLYRSEVRGAILDLLHRLSSRQKQVLQLVFYHELTVEQAAEVMGISVGSARTHYQRGKQKLQRLIQESGLKNEFRTEGRQTDQAAV